MRRPKIKHETIEKWIKYLQAQDAPVKSQDLARILVLVQEQLYYNSDRVSAASGAALAALDVANGLYK